MTNYTIVNGWNKADYIVPTPFKIVSFEYHTINEFYHSFYIDKMFLEMILFRTTGLILTQFGTKPPWIVIIISLVCLIIALE